MEVVVPVLSMYLHTYIYGGLPVGFDFGPRTPSSVGLSNAYLARGTRRLLLKPWRDRVCFSARTV